MDDQVNTQRSGEVGPALMQGWMARDEVARALGITADTLQRWQSRRIGPPLVRIGRRVFYRADAFRDWLIAQERGVLAGKRTGVGR